MSNEWATPAPAELQINNSFYCNVSTNEPVDIGRFGQVIPMQILQIRCISCIVLRGDDGCLLTSSGTAGY
jgi:hypothetical protein